MPQPRIPLLSSSALFVRLLDSFPNKRSRQSQICGINCHNRYDMTDEIYKQSQRKVFIVRKSGRRDFVQIDRD